MLDTFLFAFLNLLGLMLSSGALSLYVYHERKQHSYGMLTTKIFSFLVSSVVSTAYSVYMILEIYGIVPATALGPKCGVREALLVSVVLTQCFVYVSGALLAIDRVVLLYSPVKYAASKMSLKLSALDAAIFATTNFIAVLSCFNLPFRSPDRHVLTATVVVETIYKIYSVLFALKIIIHVTFCVQFWFYSKRQNNCHVRRQIMKSNKIALFQIFSQSTLCVVPNTLNLINMQFYNLSVEWIATLNEFYNPLFAAHIVLSALFAIYILMRNHKTTIASIS